VRVLACYARGQMHRETYRALNEHVPDGMLELVDVSDAETAYWREIAKRWDGKQTLVTVEQDIEITAETIPSFQACDEPWCCFWYHGPSYDVFPTMRGDVSQCPLASLTYLKYALGCTKFSAEIQRAVPHEMIADSSQTWGTVDVKVRNTLVEAGYRPHAHGEVEHFHEYLTPLWLENVRNGQPLTLRYLKEIET